MATPSVTLTLGDLSLALNEMGLTSVPVEELFQRLQPKPHLAPRLGSTFPSTGPSLGQNAQNIVVIHVNALEAALANLNLNLTEISAAQLINAIKKEESNLSTFGPEWKNTGRKSLRSYASTLNYT